MMLTKLGRSVVAEEGERLDSNDGAHDQDSSANRLVDFTEEPDSLATDIGGAPEVCVEHATTVLLESAFDFACNTESSVVEDDVDPAENSLGLVERVDDVLLLRDVELDNEESVGGPLPLELFEDLWLAQSGHGDVAVLQDELRHRAAEARGCASNCL